MSDFIQDSDIEKLNKLLKQRQYIYDETNDLDKVSVIEITLEGANLRGADLRNALLYKANLRRANLIDAHLEGAHLEWAHLERANLRDSHLEGAHLEDAYLQQAHLVGAHLEGAHLQWAQLQGAYLEGSYLTEAHLEGAHLEGAHLTIADLRGAHLEGAHLQGARLIRTDLTGAHLQGAHLQGVILRNAIGITPLLQERVGIAYEIHNAFANFEPKKEEYLALIRQPGNPEIYNKDHIYDYINEMFIQNINTLFPSEKEQKQKDFKKVFTKMRGSIYTEDIEFVGKSVTFAFSQNNDFKEQYIIAFLDETCNAYAGSGDTTSCSKGIIERLVLTAGTVVEILCKEGCDNEIYNKLYKLMKGKMHHHDATKEWFEKAVEDENIKKMTVDQKKADFITFMTKNTSLSEDEVKKLANEIEGGFENLQFGGNASRKPRKSSKKQRKSSRKQRKSSRKQRKSRQKMV